MTLNKLLHVNHHSINYKEPTDPTMKTKTTQQDRLFTFKITEYPRYTRYQLSHTHTKIIGHAYLTNWT